MADECVLAGEELLSLVLTLLNDLGFVQSGLRVKRPDGLEVIIEISSKNW